MLLAAMLAMVLVAAAPAFAQGPPENPGVETGPEHARSICSFSGLNDVPDEEGPFGGRTQSFGQLVKKGVANPGEEPGRAAPGFACNPTIGPSGPFTPH